MTITQQGRGFIALSSVLTGLVTLTIILRLVARKVRKAGLGADDYMFIVSVIAFYSMHVEWVLLWTIGKEGRHFSELSPQEMTTWFKLFLAIQVSYASTIAAVKISILLFLKRIFITPSFRIATNIVGAIVVAWWIAMEVTNFASCRPLEVYWNRMLPGKCIDELAFFHANAISNVITDFVILVLPLPEVWKLQIPLGKKIALSAIFMLGSFVCITSVVRATTLRYIDPMDITFTSYSAFLWSLVECACAIIGGALPALQGLLPRNFFSRTWKSIVGISGVGSSQQQSSAKLNESDNRPGFYMSPTRSGAHSALAERGATPSSLEYERDFSGIKCHTEFSVARVA
ncbi:MAG: hypothetical protein M1833_003943 [Piccolia ochrophora]|nr:MAG: hypothetical protein M1833_003943 [Piccolia ochrophora]